MVLKVKHSRDIARRNAPSKTAKKKMKQEYQGKRKDNYKKKKENTVECCICFSQVKNCSDNSIMCGKSIHFLCGECKVRCNETGNTKCPMCRSHILKMPIDQEIVIPIMKIGEKYTKPSSEYFDMRISPKKRRQYLRSGSPYNVPFSARSIKVVGWTNRFLDLEFGRRRPSISHRNINMQYYTGVSAWRGHYDGDAVPHSDSDDTASTISLIDDSDSDEELYQLAVEVERIVLGHY